MWTFLTVGLIGKVGCSCRTELQGTAQLDIDGFTMTLCIGAPFFYIVESQLNRIWSGKQI